MNTWILLCCLLTSLRPAIEDGADPEPDPDTGDEPDPDAGDEPDTDPDAGDPDPEPDVDPDPEPRLSRGQRAIVEARQRAQAAEAKAEQLQRELEGSRRQSQAQPTPDQQLWMQEEETLKHPDLEPWQRYAIQSNRQARQAVRESQQTRFQSEDMADRMRFDQLAVTKPALHKQYAARVEQEMGRMRAQGQNAPREAVMALLIGKDAMTGQVRPAKSSGDVARGKTPQARSDVSGKRGALSPVDAARRRLDARMR